jgi:putative endopeptidase
MPVFRRLLIASVCCLAAVDSLAAQGHPGLDPANLDSSCAPCQDFYRYANGGWLARTPLPPEYPSYGSFVELIDRNNQTLRAILDKTTDKQLGDFYASCVDSAAAERVGAQPLKNELDRIATIASAQDVVRTLARGHHHGWAPLFNFGALPDFKHSTMVIAAAAQGGLGLPDRDYYLRGDSAARALRTAYLAYASRGLQLLGDPLATADSEAQRILAL